MQENITTKTDKEVITFGLAYQPLQKELARQGKLAEMRLSTYLSCRMNIPGWTFSGADIIEQTGIGEKPIYKLCLELVETGIFLKKNKHMNGRALKCNFDKTKLCSYLQGTSALSGLEKVAKTTGVAPCYMGGKTTGVTPASTTVVSTASPQESFPGFEGKPQESLPARIKSEKEYPKQDGGCGGCFLTLSEASDLESDYSEEHDSDQMYSNPNHIYASSYHTLESHQESPEAFLKDLKLQQELDDLMTPSQKARKLEDQQLAAAEHLKPDEDQMQDPNLSAHKKAQLLREFVVYSKAAYNASYAMSSKKHLKLAEQWFSDNPEITVARVQEVLDECATWAYQSVRTEDETYNPHFYCRKANNVVGWTLKYWDEIMIELDKLNSDRI